MSKTSKSQKKSKISKKDIKKQEIIDVAREIFMKFGYKKTSVKDIGEQVGLDQASIYYYLGKGKGKEDLYILCLFDEIEDFKKNVKKILGKSSSIQELITNIFTEKLRFFYEKNLIDNFADLNTRKISDHLRNKLKTLQEFEHQITTKVLDHSVESGELPSINTTHLAATLTHISQGFRNKIRTNNLLGGEKLDLNQLVRELQQSVSFLFEMIISNKN
jgi:AcrR family transcriptional regulator